MNADQSGARATAIAPGTDGHASLSRRSASRKWAPRRVALVLGALALIAVVGGLLLPRSSASIDVAARASAACNDAQRRLEALPSSPHSVAEGLQIEHDSVAVYDRETTALAALGPHASAAFRAGLRDDESLLAALSSMIARPDFVQLALTVPRHPNLAPAWLKQWFARSQVLLTDAHTQFAKAGMPACERSLG